MPNSFFSFKKFTIHHDRCAMKVGTDGVLLGAWTDVTHSKHLLDIGSGTGLVALMLAQRCPGEITGIEIDKEAVEQSRENVAASPWKERIEILWQDVCQYTPDSLYDTIVSNPPYFVDSLKCPDGQRNTARHSDTLDAEQLIEKAASLLHPSGRFSVIIPSDLCDRFIQTAASYGLHPSRHTQVITRPSLPPKRSLLEFRKEITACATDELLIELDRHVYSEAYIALTKDFYLKM